MFSHHLEKALEGLVVLIADSNPYTRRLTRMMLTNLGIKSTYESCDGVAALDAIRSVNPDVMIVDWDMPVLDGREVLRIVRAPGVFPKANLPIIMLTDLGLQSRVTAAISRVASQPCRVRSRPRKTFSCTVAREASATSWWIIATSCIWRRRPTDRCASGTPPLASGTKRRCSGRP